MFGDDAPQLPDWFADVDLPVLGICYGMQLLAHAAGAPVEPVAVGEYGHTRIERTGDNALLAGLTRTQRLAIERAQRLGKRQTTVRVSGGRDLHIGFFDDGPVVLGQE